VSFAASMAVDGKRDGRREMREIVRLLSLSYGAFSACANAISRTGTRFNPNYEAVSTGLRLVYDCIDEPLEVVGAFVLGLAGHELDLSDLADTEIQFVVSLWCQLRDLAERLAKVASESSYADLRVNGQPELRMLCEALRQLAAIADVSGKLHFAQLDESGAAKERRLHQLREFISPKLINDWASFGWGRPD
jgi:hypothetical protein